MRNSDTFGESFDYYGKSRSESVGSGIKVEQQELSSEELAQKQVERMAKFLVIFISAAVLAGEISDGIKLGSKNLVTAMSSDATFMDGLGSPEDTMAFAERVIRNGKKAGYSYNEIAVYLVKGCSIDADYVNYYAIDNDGATGPIVTGPGMLYTEFEWRNVSENGRGRK